jgi:hypothetical protein
MEPLGEPNDPLHFGPTNLVHSSINPSGFRRGMASKFEVVRKRKGALANGRYAGGAS